MERTGYVQWFNGLKDGYGWLSTGSHSIVRLPYSFASRYGEYKHWTNPEELIAAACAGCFTMYLLRHMVRENIECKEIRSRATLTFDQKAENNPIAEIHFDIVAIVIEEKKEAFDRAVAQARTSSAILKQMVTNISVDAQMVVAEVDNRTDYV